MRSSLLFILQWLNLFFVFIRTFFLSEIEKGLEIAALRSQLSLYQQKEFNGKIPKPHINRVFRQYWVLMSKLFSKWKEVLVIVKPETVVAWHKTAFKIYWKRKSRSGRPKISKTTISLIKRLHKENPLLSAEKIHEKLLSLNISDAPCSNPIRKYIKQEKKPPTQNQIQSWKSFLKNHSKDIWACDFLVIPTLTFKVLYVFLIISHDRRKIEYFGVTSNPNSSWVCQQIRNATPFGNSPKYLIHDNDSIFNSSTMQNFLVNININSKKTAFNSPWQNAICERANGIIRQDLLNHIIPINERHLKNLLKDYVEKYYNTERTHQGINLKTPIPKEKPPMTKVSDTFLESYPILNGLYHKYTKIA